VLKVCRRKELGAKKTGAEIRAGFVDR